MNAERPEITTQLGAGIRRVLASNASPMTYWGTNTYILGTGEVAVIDPGPADKSHLAAILAALKAGETVSHILVSHSHIDHSSLAPMLAQITGAPVFGFGSPMAGRSEIMQKLAAHSLASGGEGVDHGFVPDKMLADGQVVAAGNWSVTAHWTPGHFGNHMCFEYEDALFSGDMVMGWATSLVSPPDGDLTDFMASADKLLKLNKDVFYPGHGHAIGNPAARTKWIIKHRKGREQAILAELGRGPTTVSAVTRNIYTETPAVLLGAAERNVFAHLIDLVQAGLVAPSGPLAFDGHFTRTT